MVIVPTTTALAEPEPLIMPTDSEPSTAVCGISCRERLARVGRDLVHQVGRHPGGSPEPEPEPEIGTKTIVNRCRAAPRRPRGRGLPAAPVRSERVRARAGPSAAG